MKNSDNSLVLMMMALVLAVSSTTAMASSERDDAKHMCKREMRSEHRADDFHGISVEKLDSGKYMVSGYAERDGRGSASFKCKVKNGHIKNLSFDGWSRGGHHGSHHRNESGGAQSWHPTDGVTCYQVTKKCLKDGGEYSERWTNREFR